MEQIFILFWQNIYFILLIFVIRHSRDTMVSESESVLTPFFTLQFCRYMQSLWLARVYCSKMEHEEDYHYGHGQYHEGI